MFSQSGSLVQGEISSGSRRIDRVSNLAEIFEKAIVTARDSQVLDKPAYCLGYYIDAEN